MDANTRTRILAEARTWLGTPYHHKAKVKGAGADCGQLLHGVYGQFFSLKAMPQDYPEDWALHTPEDSRYLDFISEYVIPTTRPVPGGVVVFRWGVAYSHGGIVTYNDTVIHAYGRTAHGVVREDNWAFFQKWPRRFYDIRPLVELGL